MWVGAYVLLCLSLAVGYWRLLRGVLRAWRALPTWEPAAAYTPRVSLSVVIAARNEEQHIEACVRSVLACEYTAELREVIVVDDYSEDATAARVSRLAAAFTDNVRLLRLGEAWPPVPPGKKSALQYGIARARGELIVTTDADCRVPPSWLRLLASAYEEHRPAAIVAPVCLLARPHWWEHFQALDVAATMGITAAALARGRFAAGNGANLCYSKEVFQAVGGFAGSEQRASGDDMFLLAKLPLERLFFLKNNGAVVHTYPCPEVRSFIQQRLRWGTKNAAFPNRWLKVVLAVMWALPFTASVNVLFAPIYPLMGGLALLQLAAKAWADHTLLSEMSRFFRIESAMRHFWPAFFAHLVYLTAVGGAALWVRRYTWKGRRCR